VAALLQSSGAAAARAAARAQSRTVTAPLAAAAPPPTPTPPPTPPHNSKVKSAAAEAALPPFDLGKKVGRKIALQRDRRATVLCVVDVADFDGSLPRAALA
jgi:hypothetical protein